jgi:non-heme chloroperoxidase
VFDEIRAGSISDRSQTYKDLADGPSFGHNRDGVEVSQGIRDAFWLQACSRGTATLPSASRHSP